MLDINNAYINTIDANIIARRYMHQLEGYILNKINKDYGKAIEFENREDIDDIYDSFTDELDSESEEGRIRDWEEITDKDTITENQIKKIYYELRKNKEKLSFTDADLIIKILCDYN